MKSPTIQDVKEYDSAVDAAIGRAGAARDKYAALTDAEVEKARAALTKRGANWARMSRKESTNAIEDQIRETLNAEEFSAWKLNREITRQATALAHNLRHELGIGGVSDFFKTIDPELSKLCEIVAKHYYGSGAAKYARGG